MKSQQLREIVFQNIDNTVFEINKALRGEQINNLKPVLKRLYPQTGIPYWYNYLKENHALPKVGVKAVSSVIESLTVGVFETYLSRVFGKQATFYTTC